MPSKLTKEQLEVALTQQEVDPGTGLAGDVKTTTPESAMLTREDFERALEYSSPSQAFGQGELRLDPSEFDFRLRPDMDNAELRAQTQSVGEHLAHGALRLGGTALTKALSGLGYAVSGIPALVTGDINVMLDNSFSEYFNNVEEQIKEAAPIYKTMKYLEGNVLEQMGTMAFWTDDFVDGLAFLGSAYLGGGGAGAIVRGATGYGRLAKALSTAARAAKTGKYVNRLAKAKKVVDALEFSAITAYNTVTESAFEAHDTKLQTLTALLPKVEAGEMTIEEANERASRAARNTFLMNSAALALSNSIETSMLFKKHDFFRMPALGGTSPLKPMTKTDAALSFMGNAALSAASEGAYEENIQSAIQDYNLDKATAFNQNSTFREMMEGIATNMVNNFSTDEGQKAIMLGALIGFIPGGASGARGAIQERKSEIERNKIYEPLMKRALADIGDVYKRDADSKEVITDENGDPVIDIEAATSKLAEIYDISVDFFASLKAAKSGSKDLFDFIRENRFADTAYSFYRLGQGQQVVDEWIDMYAGQEAENLQKLGLDPETAGISDMVEQYKSQAREYKKIWDNIENEYGGVFEFGENENDLAFKERVKAAQYREAVAQKFWKDKIRELEDVRRKAANSGEAKDFKERLAKATAESTATGEPIELIDPELSFVKPPQKIREERKAANLIKQYTALLSESYDRLSEYMNEDKMRKVYEEERATLESLMNDQEVANPNDVTASDNATQTTPSQASTTGTFTAKAAEESGFKVDQKASEEYNLSRNNKASDKPSVYVKDMPYGGKHYVYTDANDNIAKEATTYALDVQNPETGQKSKLGLTFKKDGLFKARLRDNETGKIEYIVPPIREDGTNYTPDDVIEVLAQVPSFTKGLEIVDKPDHIRFLKEDETPKKKSEVRREVEEQAQDPASEISKYIENKAKELQDELDRASERTRKQNEIFSRDSRASYLKRFYGNPAMETQTPADTFGTGVITNLAAVHNNVPGVLQVSEGDLLFTEMQEVDGKLVSVGKSIVISGIQSVDSFEDLGVTILRDLPIDMSIEMDGRPYPINIYGRYYKASTIDPTDSVETDKDGNPISVTLVDPSGKAYTLTTPMLVESVAYVLELQNAVRTKVFEDYFSDDLSDFIIVEDPLTGDEVVVYRKEGRYSMLRDGDKQMRPHGKQFQRIAERVDSEIDKAVQKMVDEGLTEVNTKKSTIKDEIRRIISGIRPPITTEALNAPDKREVQSTPPEKGRKGRKAAREEQELNKQALEEAATKEAVEEKTLEDSEEKTKDAVEEIIEDSSIVDTIDANEVYDQAYVQSFDLNKGVAHSATAVTYVYFEGNKFHVTNQEFMEYVVGNSVEGAVLTATIDFENDWFNDKQDLKAELQKGNLSEERINEILSAKRATIFNSDVDTIPIKLEYRHGEDSFTEGLYYHNSNFNSIRIPSSIYKDGMTAEQKADAELEYKNKIKSQTRKAREQILRRKLKGEAVEFPVTMKSMGTPNNVKKEDGSVDNTSLANVVMMLDENADLTKVRIGVASKGTSNKGAIYTDGGELITRYGTPGNLFWITNNTANGKEAVIKMNAGRLTLEHAKILFEAFRQTYAKGQGGAKGKYVGEGVTGDLTRDQVINLLVRQGKKFTKIDPRNAAEKHLMPKQLYVDKGQMLRFGNNDAIPLFKTTPEELKRFYDWATTQKNYSVSKTSFGRKLKGIRKPFTIGSTLSYDPAVDNYNSMILRAGFIQTDVRPVKGSNSVTANPAIVFDVNSAGIETQLTPEQEAKTKVVSETQPKPKPKESQKVSEDNIKPDPKPAPKNEKKDVKPETKELKKEVKKATSKVKADFFWWNRADEELSNFARVFRMPEGSFLYINEGIDSGTGNRVVQQKIARIDVRDDGRRVLNVAKSGGSVAGSALRSYAKGEGTIFVDTKEGAMKLASNMNIYGSVVLFTTPEQAQEAETLEEAETEEVVNNMPEETPEQAEERAEGRRAGRGRTRRTAEVEEEVETETEAPDFNLLDIDNADEIDDFPFREAPMALKDYKVGNIDKAKKWLNKRLKGAETEVVEGLIKIAKDRHAFGQMTRDAIILSRDMEVGTERHEAFHRVSLLLMDKSDRLAMYDKARKEYDLKDMSNKEVEEFLAEKYREYSLRQEARIEQKGKVSKFFAKIFQAIKRFISRFVGPGKLDDVDTSTLFSYIEDGRFYREVVKSENYEALRGQYVNFEVKGKALDMVQTEQQYREVVHGLFYLMAYTNKLIGKEGGEIRLKISNLSDIKNLKYPPLFAKVESLRDAYLSLADRQRKWLEAYNKGMTKDQLNTMKIKVFKDVNFPTNKIERTLQSEIRKNTNLGMMYAEVFDNKDVYTESLEDYLQELNIRAIRPKSDLSQEELIDEETGETRSENTFFDKIRFESSSKDNTAANIKFLLSILPISNERSSTTGMIKFSEFGPTWSKLIRDLQGFTTMETMMAILKGKSEGNMPYKVLLEHLERDETLKVQFYRTMKKQRLDFINSLIELVDGKPSIRFGSSAVRTAGHKQAKEWNQVFYRSDSLFKREKGKSPEPNKKRFDKLAENFESIHMAATNDFNVNGEITDLENLKWKLMDTLDEMGITMDDKALEYILNDINPESPSEAFITLMLGNKDFKTPIRFIFESTGTLAQLFDKETVKDSKGRKIKFEDAFLNERSIRYLGDKMAESSPVELGDSVFGARGNRYYTIMQHTYMSNLFDELHEDPEAFINERLGAAYNGNSEFLRQMVESPEAAKEFALKTLAAAVREDEADTGREYQAITDLEDYLLRMAAVHKGLLPPPTPADRRFYQFYSGLDKVDVYFDENWEISSNVIDVFVGYAKDEYNRARLVRRQVDEVIEGTRDSASLFENLHFKYVGDRKAEGKEVIIDGKLLKDKDGKYEGKGAHFTHFVEFNDSFGKTDYEAGVRTILEERLQDEIKEANRLGIVRAKFEDGKRTITDNVLIPEDILNDNKKAMPEPDVLAAVELTLLDNMVNQMVASIETNKLFTGDPASYKSFEDEIKRITGFTSTGDNLNNDFSEDYYEGDLLRQEEYNVATVSSYEFASPYYKAFVEKYTENLVKQGMATKEEAAEQAAFRLRPYLSVDQTDAQTLITPDMYRAISIKLGEWSDVKEEAYNILQSGRKPTPEEYEIISKVYFNPLKMTYVDTQYIDGVNVPTYDKMSMATLFRPIVEGTQMEDLLDRMEAKGKYSKEKPIHHFKFHTAHKTGIRDRKEFMDEKGNMMDLSTLETYPQRFDRLRLQMVTDPHAVDKTAVGTQFKKVAIANVDLTGVYEYRGEKLSGAELVVNVHEVLGELSNRGAEDFVKDLGLRPDKSVHDIPNFVRRLKEEAKTAGLPDYLVETFKVDEETGLMYMNLDSIPGGRNWTQSRIISLIKKAAVDVKMPGNVFVQMSNVGLRSIETDDSLRLMDDHGYIEAQISISVFKDVIPNYERLSHEDRVAYLERNPDLTAAGYRIPTQGQSSTYALRVVKFLPETVGDVIVLPAEGTALGGFDFDIDKLYFVRRNYDRNGQVIEYMDNENSTVEERFDVYIRQEVLTKDINKLRKEYKDKIRDVESKEERAALRVERDAAIGTLVNDYKDMHMEAYSALSIPEQNIRPALENRFLDMVFAVQLNDAHFISRTQPLGFGAEQLKKLSKDVRKWKGIPVKEAYKSLQMLSPQFQLDVKSRYKFGQTGLGAFALANVHHSLGQLIELGLFDNLGVGNTVKVNGEDVTDLSQIYGKDNEYITEWFSALIDAHVDIAADPFIYYLNTNPYTRDVITMLLRAGTGGINTFKFISQPILSEVAMQYENKDNKIGVDVLNVEEDMLYRYANDYGNLTGKDITDFDPANLSELFNEKNLEEDIKVVGNGMRTADFLQRQYQILQAFQYLQNYASALTEATLSSRVDTKKFGNSASQIAIYNARLKKALMDEKYHDGKEVFGIRNFHRVFDETYLGPLTKNGVDMSLETLSHLTIEATPAFRNLQDSVLTSIGRKYSADERLISHLSNEIFGALAGEFFVTKEGLTAKGLRSLIHGEDSVPNLIYDIKAGNYLPQHKNNILIRALSPVFEQDKPDFLQIFKPDSKWSKDSLVRGWRELLQDSNEEAVNFAYDLMYYSWFTSGFKNGLHSFYDLIPPEMLKRIGYDQFIKDKLEEAKDPDALMYLFDTVMKNNWNHRDLVSKPRGGYPYTTSDGVTYLIVGNKSTLVGYNKNGMPIHKPYIKKTGRVQTTENTKLYKYAGYDATNGNPIYYLVDKGSYYFKGTMIKENGLPASVLNSNKKGTPKGYDQYLSDEGIGSIFSLTRKNGKKIIGNVGRFVQVTDMTPVSYTTVDTGVSAMDEGTPSPKGAVPIPEAVSTKDFPKFGESKIVEVGNIGEGFYVLPSGDYVYIESVEGNTEVKNLGPNPTQSELEKIIKKCK